MSETTAIVKRDAQGRLLPGQTLNPLGRIKGHDTLAAIKALREEFSPQMIPMIKEVWGEATPKVKVQLIGYLLPYIYDKPATVHHRISTKFEDLLSQLGSNEPVTIEGQVSEDSTKE